jgi:hypothetical protein
MDEFVQTMEDTGLTDPVVISSVTGPDYRKYTQAGVKAFLCGFNIADRHTMDRVERMLSVYPDHWQGVGEVFLHRDRWSVTSDDFARLLDLAAECGLPLLVHSNRIVIPDRTDMLRRMVATYANLIIDLSSLVFEQEIAPHGVLDRQWVRLIEELPGRFVIGGDLSAGFGPCKPALRPFGPLLDALRPETARKVAHENFLALLATARPR